MQRIITTISTICLLLLVMTGCSDETESEGQQLQLWTYGLPHFERQNAEYVVAKKWGFEFKAVAGCNVSNGLKRRADRHNKKAEAAIAKKYGSDWKEKFEKEVDLEFESQEKIIALIDSLDYIQKKQAELKKEGNGLHYFMTPADSAKYNVSVNGWGKWNGENEWVTYYQLMVDPEAKDVRLISDKIIKE
jgi:hypothetical protein